MPDAYKPDMGESSPKSEDSPVITLIETNIFDIEEIYPNCTVQVLRNSVTGEVSVGWWKNGEFSLPRNLLSCQEEGCTEVSRSFGGSEEKHDPVWTSTLRRRNQLYYG